MTGVDERLRRSAASLGQDGEPIPPFTGVQRRARRRRVIGGLGAAVIVVGAAFVAATSTDNDGGVMVQEPGPTSTSTAPPAPVTDRSRVMIYLVGNEHLAAESREVEGAATPEAAIRALLAGPVPRHGAGPRFTSAIPAGTVLHSVSVDGPVATVDLSEPFALPIGFSAERARVAQVVFTVTQFEPIDRVRFRIDGTPVTTIGLEGDGVAVDNVGRADFADVTPAILVDSPMPDETVGTSLHVRGMSNTFEATVNYTLTDSSYPNVCPACAEGVIAEGHTTATAGSGTWGTFEFDIAFEAERAGLVHLSVYEISAETGLRINETTIPLLVQP